jgi:hypothetical protein
MPKVTILRSVACLPNLLTIGTTIVTAVLAWRIRKVRGGHGPERFIVQFLPTKVALSGSGEIIWEGDGLERSEMDARDYAASLGVSPGAFKEGVERAR